MDEKLPMLLPTDFFTTWSVVLLAVAVLVQLLHGSSPLSVAAAVNSAVVGVLGALVIAFAPGDPRRLMLNNFVMHAVPMLASWLLIRHARAPAWEVVGVLAMLDAAWMGTPYEGCTGMDKVTRLYGVQAEPWVLGVALGQMALACAVG